MFAFAILSNTWIYGDFYRGCSSPRSQNRAAWLDYFMQMQLMNFYY